MICPVCEKTGKTSTVVMPSGGITTLLGWQPYYDEKGRLHHHDPNRAGYDFTCSNGHYGGLLAYRKCGACGWQAKQEEIIVNGGMSKDECIAMGIPESMHVEYMESLDALKKRVMQKHYD